MSVELLFQALIQQDDKSQLEADAYFKALEKIDQQSNYSMHADLIDQLLQPRANNLSIFQAAVLAGKSDIYRYTLRYLSYPQQRTALSAIDALIQLPIDKLDNDKLRNLIIVCHLYDAKYYFQNKLVGKKILHAITSTNRVALLGFVLSLSIPGMEYEFKNMLDHALVIASTHQRYEMVRYLLKKGAKGIPTTLANIVLINDFIMLQELLSYPDRYTEKSYASAAETAIANHHNDCLRKILEHLRDFSYSPAKLLDIAISYRNNAAYSLLFKHKIIHLGHVGLSKNTDVLNTLLEDGMINDHNIKLALVYCNSQDALLIFLKHINKLGVMAIKNIFEFAISTKMDLKPIIESIDPEQYNYLEFITPSHWKQLIDDFQHGFSHNLKTVLQSVMMSEKFSETMLTVKIDLWEMEIPVSPFEYIKERVHSDKKAKEIIKLFISAGVPVHQNDIQKKERASPEINDCLQRCYRWQNAITLFAKQKAEKNPEPSDGIELKIMSYTSLSS